MQLPTRPSRPARPTCKTTVKAHSGQAVASLQRYLCSAVWRNNAQPLTSAGSAVLFGPSLGQRANGGSCWRGLPCMR
jgi:hypothetical protein